MAVASVCLLVLMVIAAATDLRDGKIYNWTTYTGIVLALVLNGLATGLGRSEIGDIGFTESLFGFLVCSAIMLICFVFFSGFGGGDVKLLAMAGAFLGPQMGIEAVLWSFVIAAAAGLVYLIWTNGAIRMMQRTFHQVMSRLNLGQWEPLTPEESRQMKLHIFLAPSALAAVLIVKFSMVHRLQSLLG